jgi:cytochrome P450 family 4
MLEMKSTISKILRKYELQPAFPHHEMELVAETILKSTNGIKISLKFR